MKIDRAKEYFKLGLITSAQVQPAVMMGGYVVEFKGKFGDANATLQTTRDDVRRFKTLDAAAKTITEVGLRKFTVATA